MRQGCGITACLRLNSVLGFVNVASTPNYVTSTLREIFRATAEDAPAEYNLSRSCECRNLSDLSVWLGMTGESIALIMLRLATKAPAYLVDAGAGTSQGLRARVG